MMLRRWVSAVLTLRLDPLLQAKLHGIYQGFRDQRCGTSGQKKD